MSDPTGKDILTQQHRLASISTSPLCGEGVGTVRLSAVARSAKAEAREGRESRTPSAATMEKCGGLDQSQTKSSASGSLQREAGNTIIIAGDPDIVADAHGRAHALHGSLLIRTAETR